MQLEGVRVEETDEGKALKRQDGVVTWKGELVGIVYY